MTTAQPGKIQKLADTYKISYKEATDFLNWDEVAYSRSSTEWVPDNYIGDARLFNQSLYDYNAAHPKTKILTTSQDIKKYGIMAAVAIAVAIIAFIAWKKFKK